MTTNRINVRVINDGTITLCLLTRFWNDFASDIPQDNGDDIEAEIDICDQGSDDPEQEWSAAQGQINYCFVKFCCVHHLLVFLSKSDDQIRLVYFDNVDDKKPFVLDLMVHDQYHKDYFFYGVEVELFERLQFHFSINFAKVFQ